MSGFAEILPLFGLNDEDAGGLLGSAGIVRREVKSQHGRTDIEVPIGKRGLLLIEVKVRITGSELPLQLERYAQMVADQHVERSLLVLLGMEAPDPSLPLFEFKFTELANSMPAAYADALTVSRVRICCARRQS
jgi:hypothetical protein